MLSSIVKRVRLSILWSIYRIMGAISFVWNTGWFSRRKVLIGIAIISLSAASCRVTKRKQPTCYYMVSENNTEIVADDASLNQNRTV